MNTFLELLVAVKLPENIKAKTIQQFWSKTKLHIQLSLTTAGVENIAAQFDTHHLGESPGNTEMWDCREDIGHRILRRLKGR